MKIFSDLHHSGLYNSLQLLFEGRLGHELYRPIGLDWFKEGYWKINDLEATARQYLEVGYQPEDDTPPLNEIAETGKVFQLKDEHHHSIQKAITFETFKEMEFDIVIASVPAHIKPFKELARMKGAKFVFQMGNMFTEVINGINEIPNLLSSTSRFPVPATCNAVFYRQEFPDIFKPQDFIMKDNSLTGRGIWVDKTITSFINVYHENPGFQNYIDLKMLMPDWEVRSYGGQCQDGTIMGIENIALKMQRSAWGLHVKAGADGYGHILHNWFACGRPVIVNYEEYKDKLAGELLIPNETCLVAEVGQDMTEVAERIQTMPPHEYQWMCQRVREIFGEKVDFTQDSENVKKWLTQLK